MIWAWPNLVPIPGETLLGERLPSDVALLDDAVEVHPCVAPEWSFESV